MTVNYTTKVPSTYNRLKTYSYDIFTRGVARFCSNGSSSPSTSRSTTVSTDCCCSSRMTLRVAIKNFSRRSAHDMGFVGSPRGVVTGAVNCPLAVVITTRASVSLGKRASSAASTCKVTLRAKSATSRRFNASFSWSPCGYSILIPAILIVFAQRADSSIIKRRNSSGVLDEGSPPLATKR